MAIETVEESIPPPFVNEVVFVKDKYASNIEENWDWISDDVALFRNNAGGLFNAVSQGGWSNHIEGTLWGPPNTQTSVNSRPIGKI